MHSTEAQEKKPFFQRGVQCSVVIVVFTEPKYKHIILILCFEGKKKVFIAVPFCFIHNYLFLRWSCQNFPNYVPGQAQFSWRLGPRLALHCLSTTMGGKRSLHIFERVGLSLPCICKQCLQNPCISAVCIWKELSQNIISESLTFNLFKGKTCFLILYLQSQH